MKAKDISLCGILTALTVIILYSTSLIPISTLSVLTLASCLIPICIIRSNIKNAIFVYMTSTLLSFFIVPINIVIFYGLFFGIYGIIKHFVERLRNLYLEIPIKLVTFNIIFFIALMIFSHLLGDIILKLPLWLLWIMAQPIFIIFDYALTLIISFYISRIHQHLK